LYPLLLNIHYILSRLGLALSLVMLIVAVYIGLIRHGDVTAAFRKATYGMAGYMLVEALIGAAMFLSGGRPGEDVHYIYGLGAVLSLPFFIFVEVTAKKRPAMGSYLWGFALLTGIVVRNIMTGPH
jgi:heme A synthase